jgi:enoyl-CoA hydratase/carnithine racemase
MNEPLVTYAVDGPVGIVALNRPEKLNAITPELKRLLVERLREADRDPATRVVVLRAEGRSFSAGYDIGPSPARAARRGNALAWHQSLTDDVALEMTPWDMIKPVIASVQGHCLGGGCELVMMCDLTIAADDALFGEPEIRFSNVGPLLAGLQSDRVPLAGSAATSSPEVHWVANEPPQESYRKSELEGHRQPDSLGSRNRLPRYIERTPKNKDSAGLSVPTDIP